MCSKDNYRVFEREVNSRCEECRRYGQVDNLDLEIVYVEHVVMHQYAPDVTYGFAENTDTHNNHERP